MRQDVALKMVALLPRLSLPDETRPLSEPAVVEISGQVDGTSDLGRWAPPPPAAAGRITPEHALRCRRDGTRSDSFRLKSDHAVRVGSTRLGDEGGLRGLSSGRGRTSATGTPGPAPPRPHPGRCREIRSSPGSHRTRLVVTEARPALSGPFRLRWTSPSPPAPASAPAAPALPASAPPASAPPASACSSCARRAEGDPHPSTLDPGTASAKALDGSGLGVVCPAPAEEWWAEPGPTSDIGRSVNFTGLSCLRPRHDSRAVQVRRTSRRGSSPSQSDPRLHTLGGCG